MRTINRIIDFFTSLRLTVILLAFAMVLVFVGTLAQVELGLYAVQEQYFQALFVYWSPEGAPWRIPVLPGGYLLGLLLLVNLIAAHIRRFELSRKKTGIFLIHSGLILLLLGQFFTEVFQVESNMRMREGQSRNYSESSFDSELIVADVTDAEDEEVVAVPESMLRENDRIPLRGFPLTLRVVRFVPNSRLAQRPADAAEAPPADRGLGRSIRVTEVPSATRMDERNLPSAVVEVLSPDGSLGTWLVSIVLDERQTFSHGGREYALQLRLARYYKEHTITLLDFSHDKYEGTEIPKNFSSRIRLRNPVTGEDREVLIYMNNPLRYGGETYYQSGFDPNDDRVTVLQVVRNPSWLTPYFSCALVGLGLTVQFMMHLVGFAKRRMKT